jgi:excisionase family DNA binding protein
MATVTVFVAVVVVNLGVIAWAAASKRLLIPYTPMISIDPSFIDALADAVANRVPKPQPPQRELAPILVGADELARLLSISRPFVDRLRAEGRIPSILVGTRRLFDPVDVVAALKEAS